MELFSWTGNTPDLNPIENLWHRLKTLVRMRRAQLYQNATIEILISFWDIVRVVTGFAFSSDFAATKIVLRSESIFIDPYFHLLSFQFRCSRLHRKQALFCTQFFEVRNSVRQGDALACLLFNLALEWSLRSSGINTRGTIFTKTVQLLANADDIVIIARSKKALSEACLALKKLAGKLHLIINEEKKSNFTGAAGRIESSGKPHRKNVPEISSFLDSRVEMNQRNALKGKVRKNRQAARNRGGKNRQAARNPAAACWESELNELRLEIESIRSNVKRTSCAEDRKKTSSNYRISIGRAEEHVRETSPAVLMAEATIPVTTPIKEEKGMDDLRVVYVKVKGEQEMVNAVIDTGAQMPVVRPDVVEGQSIDNRGSIQITSAFGEHEMGEIKDSNMELNDFRHGVVPVSKIWLTTC
ncbi:putative endonuclease-reverse transcriptase [Trichonephila clavipes]|uniref:Putative endonuclease-reverse transcriptase n=1 Tax=Trichonephila clavipes TaxID=2585209 RepID=A0A8X6WAU6_TRICX|nr:putative endonuclease-reverse transcriptase [Trichonephila clavipes]